MRRNGCYFISSKKSSKKDDETVWPYGKNGENIIVKYVRLLTKRKEKDKKRGVNKAKLSLCLTN
jgi:hypothetical protein